jgi:hypothetical protein
MTQLLTFESPSDVVIRWIRDALARAKLEMATSFDLQTCREDYQDCPCPHHDMDACDCQMVMLLVYGEDVRPATLVVHSHDGRTWLTLADVPGQRPSPALRAAIYSALSINTTPSLRSIQLTPHCAQTE